MGWLDAASHHIETLQVLLEAGASRNGQKDKDSALSDAATSGDVRAVRALIGYGANPNADLTKLTFASDSGGWPYVGQRSGSLLINAASSGNPEMIREILLYHPNLEARNSVGQTAIFVAGGFIGDPPGAAVECVRVLAEAAANLNARDKYGNTPLHRLFLVDVDEELLKLGADVNARNNDGETPIFTNVSDDSVVLFLEHGADPTVRNNKGETAIEAARREHGPYREQTLREAIHRLEQK
jgi:ankyrin repeat protein